MPESSHQQLDNEDFVARMAIEKELRSPDTSLDDLYKLQAKARALPPAVDMLEDDLWVLLNQLTNPFISEERSRDVHERAGRSVPPA